MALPRSGSVFDWPHPTSRPKIVAPSEEERATDLPKAGRSFGRPNACTMHLIRLGLDTVVIPPSPIMSFYRRLFFRRLQIRLVAAPVPRRADLVSRCAVSRGNSASRSSMIPLYGSSLCGRRGLGEYRASPTARSRPSSPASIQAWIVLRLTPNRLDSSAFETPRFQVALQPHPRLPSVHPMPGLQIRTVRSRTPETPDPA